MRLSTFPLLALFLLTACTPTTPPAEPAASSSASSALTITLEKTVTEDKDGVPHTAAVLHLSGAINQDVPLGDIVGELKYVNPNGYARFALPNADTVAAFTAWFGGGGEEIWITQYHDPHQLDIQRRYGDEGAICNPPGLVVDIPLPGDVTVMLQNMGDAVEKSSIDFPCTAP